MRRRRSASPLVVLAVIAAGLVGLWQFVPGARPVLLSVFIRVQDFFTAMGLPPLIRAPFDYVRHPIPNG